MLSRRNSHRALWAAAFSIPSLIASASLLSAANRSTLVARRLDCVTPGQAATISTESISCTTPRPNTEVWRIDRPNVRQRETSYPGIRFRQGDLVSVFAGGCAQAGGMGLTWKRYVNPMSPNRDSDDQYHGLIAVPGFGPLRHIRDAVLAGGIAILADPGADAALKLGYADDGYSDNGYTGREDGWWQQCNDLSDAWVVIAIQHDCATSAAPSCIRGRALDIVWDRTDANGFPLNPDWVWRRVVGTEPEPSQLCSWSTKIGGFPGDDAALCASQLTAKDRNGGCVQGGTAGNIAGHMNWIGTPVTSVGWIWWSGHDYWFDDDYTFNFAPVDDSGNPTRALFVQSQTNPQIEFSSDETIDKFDTAPWWQSLHLSVDAEDRQKHGQAIVTGKSPPDFFPGGTTAIVIGQLGLDCAHTCGTELHPAWAVFIHVKNDPQDDTWAFFVRNWGNEGWCSTDDHRIATQQLTVKFPRRNATGVEIIRAATVTGATHAVPPFDITLTPERDGALGTFYLPPSSDHGVVFGELHLRWRTRLPERLVADASALLRKRPAAIVGATRRPDTEKALNQRLTTLRPAARDSLRVITKSSRMARRVVPVTGRVVARPAQTLVQDKRVTAVRIVTTPAAEARRKLVVARLLPDTARLSPALDSMLMMLGTQTARVSVPAQTQWTNAGIRVAAGDMLEIVAEGRWSNGGETPQQVGPTGFGGFRLDGTPLPSANLGSLIARVGDAVFAVGERYAAVVANSGELFLGMNDTAGTFADNTGSMQVVLTRRSGR